MAWDIDAIHSQVHFSVHRLTGGTVQGRFNEMHGYVHIDEQTPSHSWVDVAIATASLEVTCEECEAPVQATDLLNPAEYPTITFKSVRVEHIANRDYKVIGELTMHGATRLVAFDATFHEVSGVDSVLYAVLTARTKIDRRDFGFTWEMLVESGKVALGDVITFEFEFASQSVPAGKRGHTEAKNAVVSCAAS